MGGDEIGPEKVWDVAVVGGGVAGLTASSYLARAGFSCLLINAENLGGKVRSLRKIENWPGMLEGISGLELTQRFIAQSYSRGVVFRTDRIGSIERGAFSISLEGNKERYRALSVIVATGTVFKSLNIAGERKLAGRGLYHSAFYVKDRWDGEEVGVVGGGEAAAHQALELAERGARVRLFIRRDRLKVTKHLAACVEKTGKIVLERNRIVIEAVGEREVCGVVSVGTNGEGRRLDRVNAIFVLIGQKPSLPRGTRNTEGVFIAGDARIGSRRQGSIAASDGFAKAMDCEDFLISRCRAGILGGFGED